MVQHFITGFFSFPKALKFLGKHKLWGFVLIPGLVSLVLAGLIFVGAYTGSDELGAWLVQVYPFEWGKGAIEYIAEGLSFFLVLMTSLLAFKYLVMIVVSPFMGTLSERVESKITGQAPPAISVKAMISDMMRGIRIAMRNLVRELILVVILTIAGSIFGVIIPFIGGMIATAVIFMVQAYFAGFGNLDYLLERKRFGVKDSVGFVRRNKWLAIGNGTAFTLLLFVPILGWFLAPALGTVGATVEGLKRLEKDY